MSRPHRPVPPMSALTLDPSRRAPRAPLVAVAAYSTVLEAQMARGSLMASGVEAWLGDEHVATHLPGLVGGVKVLVAQPDAQDALALLQQDPPAEENVAAQPTPGTAVSSHRPRAFGNRSWPALVTGMVMGLAAGRAAAPRAPPVMLLAGLLCAGGAALFGRRGQAAVCPRVGCGAALPRAGGRCQHCEDEDLADAA